MFPKSSLNIESGGFSETWVTEIKNPGHIGDKPATTYGSHFAALSIFHWTEIVMSEGERFSTNQVHPIVLGILTPRSPIDQCQCFRLYGLRFGEQMMNEICVSGAMVTV